MKRIVKIALTSFAVFSLISCVDNQTSNSNSDSSSVPIQDVYHHVTFLNDDETLLYETPASGLEPEHQNNSDYSEISNLLPYQLGLYRHNGWGRT